MKKLISATACAAFLLLAAACSSQKNGSAASTSSTLTPDAEASAAQRYASMTAAYGLWRDVRMPVRATLRKPFDISASGRLTMVRDSLIHISMRLLGIELAVVRITPDSVYVFDKFHRYLVVESTKAVTKHTDLTLADLQCAILGRAFVPGHGVATPQMASLLKFDLSGDNLTIAPAKRPKGYDWHMDAATLPDGRIALSALSVTPDGHTPATCSYTPAGALSAIGAIASALDITARVAGKQFSASLTLDIREALWNNNPVPAMPSLRGYTRIPLADLLHAGLF